MPTAAQYGMRRHIGEHLASGDKLLSCLKRLQDESIRQRRAILLCAAVGILMQIFIFGIALLFAEITSRLHHLPRAPQYQTALIIAAILCGLMLLIAIFTKPEGRAERANKVFDEGMKYHANEQATPVEKFAISLIMMVALYGSYAIVEASKRAIMRRRLSGVDRYECARILAAISSAPTGLPWQSLLLAGQFPPALRGPLAFLILDGWIELIDGGKIFIQCTPAMQKLLHRHPLADAFRPGE